MKSLRVFISRIAVALGLIVSLMPLASAAEQEFCPIMVEDGVDPDEVVEYGGQQIFLCCGTCTKVWETNPDYFARLAFELKLLPQFEELPEGAKSVELLDQRFCPLRPDSVVGPESPSVEYQGKTIYFFKERDIERRWSPDPEAAFKQAREAGLLPQFDENPAGSSAAAAAVPGTDITLTCDKVKLEFDITEFDAEAGKPVRLTLINPQEATQPHNVVFLKPGMTMRVGMDVNRSMSDPEFLKNPIPESPHILAHSGLLKPGASETFEFTAPEDPGVYPFICTFPGHWGVMKGEMTVR